MKLESTKEKGDTGENIACMWLQNHNFLVIERNYRKKWGEIDIICAKDKIIHFVEVKSVTTHAKGHRPEENVHEIKQKRLKRAIQTYLAEKKNKFGGTFSISCACGAYESLYEEGPCQLYGKHHTLMKNGFIIWNF